MSASRKSIRSLTPRPLYCECWDCVNSTKPILLEESNRRCRCADLGWLSLSCYAKNYKKCRYCCGKVLLFHYSFRSLIPVYLRSKRKRPSKQKKAFLNCLQVQCRTSKRRKQRWLIQILLRRHLCPTQRQSIQ